MSNYKCRKCKKVTELSTDRCNCPLRYFKASYTIILIALVSTAYSPDLGGGLFLIGIIIFVIGLKWGSSRARDRVLLVEEDSIQKSSSTPVINQINYQNIVQTHTVNAPIQETNVNNNIDQSKNVNMQGAQIGANTVVALDYNDSKQNYNNNNQAQNQQASNNQLPQQVPQQVPQQTTQQVQQVPQYIPQQPPQYIPQQVPSYIPQQAPQQIPQQAPQYNPQQFPQYAPQQVPQYLPQLVPQYMPQYIPQQIPQYAPQYMGQQAPVYFPQQIPQYIPQQSPQSPTSLISQQQPQQVTSFIPQQETPESSFSSQPQNIPQLQIQQEPDQQNININYMQQNSDENVAAMQVKSIV